MSGKTGKKINQIIEAASKYMEEKENSVNLQNSI